MKCSHVQWKWTGNENSDEKYALFYVLCKASMFYYVGTEPSSVGCGKPMLEFLLRQFQIPISLNKKAT